MKLLAVGDVCGPVGCETVYKQLPLIKKDYGIDVTVINGENSAEGNGITPETADFLFSCGADVITGGNHSLRNVSIHPYFEYHPYILRPHNFKSCDIGTGYVLVDFGRFSVAVLNLSGTVYLENPPAENPFICADELVERANADSADFTVLDFHAEATSEKIAIGNYLDGKISAVFGTHTHVPTADETILPLGTGYITDIGMTGPVDSVLGVKTDIIINRFRNKDMSKFRFAEGKGKLNGCIFDFSDSTGKTVNIKRITI